MENIGARIKAFRESRGLTQKDIFQATHGEVKQTSLSAIENNQAKPGFDTLAALLAAYPGLSSDWLLLGAGPMLRDGRALTPRPAPEPTPGLTSGAATVAEAENVLLRERLLDKQAIITLLSAEVTELRGKSSGSSDAAGRLHLPAPAPLPIVGFRLSVQHRTSRPGMQASR